MNTLSPLDDRHVIDADRLLSFIATIVYQSVDGTVSEEIDDKELNYREDTWVLTVRFGGVLLGSLSDLAVLMPLRIHLHPFDDPSFDLVLETRTVSREESS